MAAAAAILALDAFDQVHIIAVSKLCPADVPPCAGPLGYLMGEICPSD
jgi:hypothetical protein